MNKTDNKIVRFDERTWRRYKWQKPKQDSAVKTQPNKKGIAAASEMVYRIYTNTADR